MFRVKICGVTTVADAQAIAEAGADAIGLNFHPQSPRYIDIKTAKEIAAKVKQRLLIVGVFVNASLHQMVQLADELPLDYIQLHGDEPTAQLAKLAPRPTICAFRLRPDDERNTIDAVTAALSSPAPPAGILIDAYQKGQFGGTGQTVNWPQIRHVRSGMESVPLILAGGLEPANVGQAIRQTGCEAVDVASGVELEPGHKDVDKTRQFARAALEAWQEYTGRG